MSLNKKEFCPICNVDIEENWIDLWVDNSNNPVYRFRCIKCGNIFLPNRLPKIMEWLKNGWIRPGRY